MVVAREIIDIIEIIYYAPVLCITVFVALRHGFKKEQGWYFLIVLALIRLIGSSTGIAAVSNPDNENLIACTIVCGTIGLSPLLLCLIAFMDRTYVLTPFPFLYHKPLN